MDIRPIRSESDHAWAIAELERYFDHEPEPGTPDADRFDVLSDLVTAYEARHYPLPAVDPIDALRAFMDSTGRSQADLAMVLNSRPRASEVLNRKRALTIEMIHALHTAWGVPPQLLAVPYKLAA